MGILDALMGNASELANEKVARELAPVLIEGESLERAFKFARDLVIFTDFRLILVNKQGLTGTKVSYHTIPYKSITHFAVETAGTFDADAELKIWLSGSGEPIETEFTASTDVKAIQQLLAYFVFTR